MTAPYPPRLTMTSADQLTVARAASVPVVVLLFAWNFPNYADPGRPRCSALRWRPTGSTEGSRGVAGRRQLSRHIVFFGPILNSKVLVLGHARDAPSGSESIRPGWSRSSSCLRGAHHRAPPGGDRAGESAPRGAPPSGSSRRGPARPRSRDRRVCRRRRVEHERRVVGAPRRPSSSRGCRGSTTHAARPRSSRAAPSRSASRTSRTSR